MVVALAAEVGGVDEVELTIPQGIDDCHKGVPRSAIVPAIVVVHVVVDAAVSVEGPVGCGKIVRTGGTHQVCEPLVVHGDVSAALARTAAEVGGIDEGIFGFGRRIDHLKKDVTMSMIAVVGTAVGAAIFVEGPGSCEKIV